MSFTKKELIEALKDADDNAVVTILVSFDSVEKGTGAEELEIESVGTGDNWQSAYIGA